MTWILTRFGRRFDISCPTVDMIDPRDIAHALAHICRFGGHTREHYSVAQHSVIASQIVPEHAARHALLHDATEAYIGDMVRPLKQTMPNYQWAEAKLWRVICARFGLDPEMPAEVHQADMVMLATEKRDLMPEHPDPWECLAGVEPLSATIKPWGHATAFVKFANRFQALFPEHLL
jgi:hypothetical protein